MERTPWETKISEFTFLRTIQNPDTDPDEWDVDKIVRHRTGKNGQLEFLTKWENAEGEDTWEPVDNFFPGVNGEFFRYCQAKGLKLDLLQHLKP